MVSCNHLVLPKMAKRRYIERQKLWYFLFQAALLKFHLHRTMHYSKPYFTTLRLSATIFKHCATFKPNHLSFLLLQLSPSKAFQNALLLYLRQVCLLFYRFFYILFSLHNPIFRQKPFFFCLAFP